jgi:hypothetical protein
MKPMKAESLQELAKKIIDQIGKSLPNLVPKKFFILPNSKAEIAKLNQEISSFANDLCSKLVASMAPTFVKSITDKLSIFANDQTKQYQKKLQTIEGFQANAKTPEEITSMICQQLNQKFLEFKTESNLDENHCGIINSYISSIADNVRSSVQMTYDTQMKVLSKVEHKTRQDSDEKETRVYVQTIIHPPIGSEIVEAEKLEMTTIHPPPPEIHYIESGDGGGSGGGGGGGNGNGDGGNLGGCLFAIVLVGVAIGNGFENPDFAAGVFLVAVVIAVFSSPRGRKKNK